MDLQQAQCDLDRALDEQAEPNGEHRIRAARQVLVACGSEALGVEASAGRTLPDIIKLAGAAPASPARRAFAVLVVRGLAVDGLVAAKSRRAEFDRDLCAFLERSLPSVLQRFGYAFADETYLKRRSLERLHSVIDDLLQPLEPTFPPGVQGLYAG
jgi:hypothetical protein